MDYTPSVMPISTYIIVLLHNCIRFKKTVAFSHILSRIYLVVLCGFPQTISKGMEIIMKKYVSLFIVVVMLALALCSCSVNVESLNPYDYITLGDYEKFDLDDLVDSYVDARMALSEASTTFNLDWGYIIKFNLVTEIVGGDDKTTTYTRYEMLCSEGDKYQEFRMFEHSDNAYEMNFHSALMYDVTDADKQITNASLRNIKIGTAFDFTMTAPYVEDNPDLSGKKLRFTITPVEVIPPVYTDNDIINEINAFYAKYPQTLKFVEMGCIVTANIEGKIDGQSYDGGKIENITFTVGCSGYPEEFDEKIVGAATSAVRKFDITYPADWTDENLAGKTVSFSFKATDIYSLNSPVVNNTKYKSLYELKEALRFNYYVTYKLIELVYDRSTLNKNHSGLNKEYAAYFKNVADDMVNQFMEYSEYHGTKYNRDEAIIQMYGSKEAYNEYINSNAAESVKETFVCWALAEKLGIKYTEDDYKKDFAEFAEAYNTMHETEYSDSKIEQICNKNLLKMFFLEDLVCRELCKKVEGFERLSFID